MDPPFLHGLTLNLTLIVALGPQNVFVIKQGIARQGLALVIGISVVCSAALCAAGLFLLGSLTAEVEQMAPYIGWGAALFLTYYGVMSLRRAVRPPSDSWSAAERGVAPAATTRALVAGALAFALLNPMCVVENVVVLGAVGARYPLWGRTLFWAGVTVATALWLTALGYAAAYFSNQLRRQGVQRAMDACIALLMFWFAYRLI